MKIDAQHLFQASHEGLWRLCIYVGMNPNGLSRQGMVLGLLFRLNAK